MKNIIVIFAIMIFTSISTAHADDMSYNEAKRAPRDFGEIITAKTEVNKEGQTRLFFERCFQPRIGNLEDCHGRLYEINEKTGLLDENALTFGNSAANYKTIILPAGKYYMKISSNQAGKYYYTMGEIIVAPFVTNFIHVELE